MHSRLIGFVGNVINLFLLLWSCGIFAGLGYTLVSEIPNAVRQQLGQAELPFSWMISKPFGYLLIVSATLIALKELLKYGGLWKRVLVNLILAVFVALVVLQEAKVERLIWSMGS